MTRGNRSHNNRRGASIARLTTDLRTALFHWRRRREPAVLGHAHNVPPATRCCSSHEVHLEQRLVWRALAWPDENAMVRRLRNRSRNGDASVAVIGLRQARQQHTRQLGMEADSLGAPLVRIGRINRWRWQRDARGLAWNRRCLARGRGWRNGRHHRPRGYVEERSRVRFRRLRCGRGADRLPCCRSGAVWRNGKGS